MNNTVARQQDVQFGKSRSNVGIFESWKEFFSHLEIATSVEINLIRSCWRIILENKWIWDLLPQPEGYRANKVNWKVRWSTFNSTLSLNFHFKG